MWHDWVRRRRRRRWGGLGLLLLLVVVVVVVVAAAVVVVEINSQLQLELKWGGLSILHSEINNADCEI